MNETIKLAIEKGGYEPKDDDPIWDSVLLDPAFWQALGKALEWDERYEYQEMDGVKSWLPQWKVEWHSFIDHIAEGKNPDEFFEKLLPN